MKQPGSPLTDTEQIMAALWAEVMPISEALAAEDNFFALGGDSIAMITVLFRIQEEFAVSLPDESVLTAPSLRELAGLVDAARR